MRVLGIGGLLHNASLTLIEDGKITFSIEIERVTRRKNDGLLEARVLRDVLAELGITLSGIDLVAFADRYLFESRKAREVVEFLSSRPIAAFDHHLCHCASSYFCSGYNKAVVVSIDGKGDGLSSLVCYGDRQSGLAEIGHTTMECSLGRLWNALCTMVGMPGYYNAGKTMALSSYGQATEVLDGFAQVQSDGSIYFRWKDRPRSYFYQKTNMVEMLMEAFGLQPLISVGDLDQDYFDMVATIQAITDQIVIDLVEFAYRLTDKWPICLAGGVGLNVLTNSVVQRSCGTEVYVQPAASDAGLSLGAAILGWKSMTKTGEFFEFSPYLGRGYEREDVLKAVSTAKCAWSVLDNPTIVAADLLRSGAVIGWFHGREEYGPRALGNRSILADPRVADNRQYINEEVKGREWFRPLAPSVRLESLSRFFDTVYCSPYMLQAPRATDYARRHIPAALHVDQTGRVQTVAERDNATYYALLVQFGELTGVDCLLNTSFNLRGQPIVGTPRQALDCFLNSKLDYLVIEGVLVSRG